MLFHARQSVPNEAHTNEAGRRITAIKRSSQPAANGIREQEACLWKCVQVSSDFTRSCSRANKDGLSVQVAIDEKPIWLDMALAKSRIAARQRTVVLFRRKLPSVGQYAKNLFELTGILAVTEHPLELIAELGGVDNLAALSSNSPSAHRQSRTAVSTWLTSLVVAVHNFRLPDLEKKGVVSLPSVWAFRHKGIKSGKIGHLQARDIHANGAAAAEVYA